MALTTVAPHCEQHSGGSAADRHSEAEKRTGSAAPHDGWLVDARIRRPEPGRWKKAGHVGAEEVESLGLPPPTPYLAGKTAVDFLHGANFAVGGATALDPAFLQSRGITSFVPVSLSNQTSWFNGVLQLLDSTGNGQRKIMASSLLYLGEIGFNDYSFVAVFGNGTVGLAQSLVPHIVGAIRSVLTDAIGVGARTMVVAGMIPMGCEPELLALLPGGAGDYYDRASGCIARFNQLAQLHNRALKRMLCQLRRDHPGAAIHYADLYRLIAAVVSSPRKYGAACHSLSSLQLIRMPSVSVLTNVWFFLARIACVSVAGFGDMPLAACCGGGGGPYNFNFTFFCGTPAATACADPSESVSWDGIHYTEAANRFVAHAILRGL
uniref:GDSL esterase/lipase n=1 Tax=Aegilops tauschii TaxID=37682 RepID=M8BUY1_AEGTA